MKPPLKKLSGTDRRSTGKSNEVAADIVNRRIPFAALIEGMLDEDPVIRMRSADAAEKVTVRHPEFLQPHARILIDRIARIDQQEVRWHVAQMIPRMALSPSARKKAAGVLLDYLKDESRIVQTFALQALVDLADQDPSLRNRVRRVITTLARSGAAAVQARIRKLRPRLKRW